MSLSLIVRLASACLASFVLTAPAAATAPNVRQDQWHLRFLNAAAAHVISEGDGVTVAVPDTGIDPHPDLRENLLAGTDLSGKGDGRQDHDGHGTSMAGLIGAHGQPDHSGALGVAPRAKLLPIRTRLVNGKGSADELAASVEWAVANHADVISISAVAGATSRLQGAIRSALEAEIVVVAAVGNQPEDRTVGYPASEPGVIGVGGIDRSGIHASISATGPEIDIVAPAVDIYSTSYDGKYSKGTGTSSATAIVAGAAALIRSKYPNLPAQEVAHRLTATAVDKGPPGRDDQYGYGVIDLVAALTADVPPLGFESSNVTPPASAEAAPDKGDSAGTIRGLATLGVLVAAGGGYLFWRRRRRADDPPPRVSR
ncbi:type VII secretion-associated serine protease mycosin [Micromonospora tulbaghiae]|uniref:type VII secretion-associated serine protease mycosin n=1 Tax=Micromonospora tulbaghiae TaxID=479978 RepID=UPI0037148FB5